jgi:peptidoglycan hydrolase-like protein with peptidoglycan-binding domain
MIKLVNYKLLIICSALIILTGVITGCLTAAAQPVTNPLPPATVQVARTTLVETRTVSGTLGYGNTVPVRSSRTGTLTWIAPVGTIVEQGEALFKIDEQPVVAFFGEVPMYRSLDIGRQGAEVLQLQENLTQLGYTGFKVDGYYTTATASAVRTWQADLGLPITGTVEPGEVIFIPGAVRISEHTARPGDPIGSSPLLHYTGLGRVVIVSVSVTDLALVSEGGEVSVTIPGGGVVVGEISQIGAVVNNGAVEVTVSIADQEALGSLIAAPVDVDFVSQERADVLAVPVAALLALAEGGYGVEIVDGDNTYIVPIRTGMFAAGRVEISGDAIAEGVRVGVAR